MAEDNSWAYKQVLRATIARQTREYLDNGGVITQVEQGDGYFAKLPPKMTRKQQVEDARRRFGRRRK